MVWYCSTIHRGPPSLIKAHFSHFRWQLCQIACHFAYIQQNKWLIPTRLAQPLYLWHNSSLFAAIEICLLGRQWYCEAAIVLIFVCAVCGGCCCFAASCCSCSARRITVSLLFASMYTKICYCVERPRWQVTMAAAEGGSPQNRQSFRNRAWNRAAMGFTRPHYEEHTH